MSSRIHCIKKYMAFFILILLIVPSLHVWAASAEIHYGSEAYEWTLDQDYKIGVYLETDEMIDSYMIQIAYDPERLQYLDGAELVEDGLLVIQGGSGTRSQYRQMLRFRPIAAGRTQVTIVQASVTGGLESGALEVLQLPEVQVDVEGRQSIQLSSLAVNGTAVEGFSPEQLEYELEVPYEMEQLDISAEAINEEAVVTVLNTALAVGYNEILVQVTDQEGVSGFYQLEVYRESESAVNTAFPESQPMEIQTQPYESTEELNPEEPESAEAVAAMPTENAATPQNGRINGLGVVLIVLGAVLLVVIGLTLLTIFFRSVKRKQKLQKHQALLNRITELTDDDFQYDSLSREKYHREVYDDDEEYEVLSSMDAHEEAEKQEG